MGSGHRHGGVPAVFLDRDGVLNRAFVRDGTPHPPARVQEVELLPGVQEACRTLRDAGLALVVVTNQPDIARGTQTRGGVEAINAFVREHLQLDDIRVCPHDDSSGCPCRKPAPGLLLEAARDLAIDLPASVMVGDRWRDIECGKRAGCRTIFIDHHYTEPRPEAPDFTAGSLPEAVPWILKNLHEWKSSR
jgi:D-glycero-D-manno-heptose 1,7-bisphosphate phosphatase